LVTGRPKRKSTVTKIERAGVLTAAAGERYLDAIRARNITAAVTARELRLAEGAKPREVRDACSTRFAAAERRKARALEVRDALGPIPTAKDLSLAFSGLHQQDRRTVLKHFPAVQQLMEEPRRERARAGLSL
jgi:hypothetical protein